MMRKAGKLYMTVNPKPTTLQLGVFYTIRNNPRYEFTLDELKVAKRMVSRGWLRRSEKNPSTFSITKDGSSVYRSYRVV